MEQRRMSDGEILDAYAHGDLVVNDAVATCRQRAQKNDLSGFHGRCVSAPNGTEISCGEPEETIHEAKSVDGRYPKRRSQACSPSASSIG